MQIKAIDYFTYKVSDLKRSTDFYQNILGLKLTSSGDGWAEFEIGNSALCLVSFGKPEGPSNGAGVALAVEDLKGSLVELKKKGVKVMGEVWETPVCHGATIEDLDGNTIYLHHRKDGTVG